MHETPARWIATPHELADWAERATTADWLAIDTESNSAFVYRERVCLVQLNAGGDLAVVDTLALGPDPDALDPLRPLLEDPGRQLMLHGGAYDVLCLKRSYGIALRGCFDSQIAAALLGWQRTGYGHVVAAICDVELDKSWSQYDWASRPVDPEALQYAIADVAYLPRICQDLQERIRAADLEEELAIAIQAMEEAEPRPPGFDPADLWRIKGVHKLPAAARPVLTALYGWRDGLAAATDMPPGRILNNEALLAVARETPRSFSQLKRIRLKGRFLREHGEELIQVVKTAVDQPPAVPEPPRQREVDPDEVVREKGLKSWRQGEAKRRDVPVQVVLPAKALEHLKRYGAGDLEAVPQLGPKRIRLYGATLRKLCG